MKRDARFDQRGVMLSWLAVSLGAAFAMTAVGPGLGRLTLVASEVQTAADAAALAGGTALFENASPEWAALVVLAGNQVDRRPATTMLRQLDEGFYDSPTRHFTVGGIPRNAVRAVVSTEIRNPFTAIIHRERQVVEKVSYASMVGLRGGQPTLPIVVGDCYFDTECYDQSCMPALAQVPTPAENSAWTTFFTNTNTPNVLSFVPEPCGGGGSEDLFVGDYINIGNGQMTPVLRAFDCLIDYGITEHLIPIVSCDGQFNQSKEVLGFATIALQDVVFSGGGEGIVLQTVFKTELNGTLGGTNFGSGNLVLVTVDPE